MTLKDKTTVTFYNGLTTIGGPMIEVAYNKSHVLFDLGEVYRPELKLPDESYQTLIKNELIGDVPNFYAGSITAHLLPALNEKGDFLLPAAGHDKSYTRPIIAAEYKKPIQVGDITLKIYPSDHDAYGATGLIVRTPDKQIAYTGDIRLHGYHPDWVREFMKASKGSDMLIIEGTGVSWPEEKHDENSEEFTGPKNEVELT